MELVEVTVFYLEMLAPSQRAVPTPRGGLTVDHAEAPPVPYYRCLYDAVGKDYHWLSRRKLPDEELERSTERTACSARRWIAIGFCRA